MMELPDYKLPRQKRRARALHARKDVPAARRHDNFFHDGADLVPGVVSASRRLVPRGPAINYSLAAMIGRCDRTGAGAARLQLADRVALIPGMAAREVAVAALGTVYAIEGGKEAAEQIGQVLANNWSLATALSLLVW